MVVFKCKICGGSLNILADSRICTCEYCGTNQTIPELDDDKKTALFNRANRLRIDCEFDKASAIYENIVAQFPDEAEAFWGLCLCKYGIEYVDDPETAKKIPTCHRTVPGSIFDDNYYLKALEFAGVDSRKLYAAEATTIDGIQKNILDIVSNEKPYDIFICYKETDDITGKRTEDSIIAQDIYTELTSEGYRVFFARVSLRSVAGKEYEPYIYAALASAKVMIVVGTEYEHLDAVWVKNEWSRYLHMMHDDRTRQLIPCYRDMDAYDLPKEFKNIQALNIADVTFFHSLLSVIKKTVSAKEAVAESQFLNDRYEANQSEKFTGKLKKHKKLITAASISAAFLIILAVLLVPFFKKMPAYNAAEELLAAGKYAEATWAFDALDGFLKAEELKEAAEMSWRTSLASIATQSYMGGGTGSSYSSYYVDENGVIKNFNHDEGDEHFTVIKQEKGKISSLSSGKTIYALTETGDVVNAQQNYLVKDASEWQNIVQILPALEDTNIALRADGRIVAGKESGNLHNLSDEAIKWENIVRIACAFDRINAGDVTEAVLVGIDNEGNVLVDTYSENENISGLDILKNLTDITDIDIRILLSELDFVALTNYGSVISYVNGNFNEIEAPDVIDVELTVWEDVTYCILDSKGDLRIKNREPLMSDVVYINDGFFVTKNGNIFILEDYYIPYGSSVTESDSVKVTEATTKIADEWLKNSKLTIEEANCETQIKTKYLTFDLPVFWNGNWVLKETDEFNFTVYEKRRFQNNQHAELFSIVISEDREFDKIADITIEDKQYNICVDFSFVGYDNELPVLCGKMAESLDAVLATIKPNGNYTLNKADKLKNHYKTGTFTSDAADLIIENDGDAYNIVFNIFRLTNMRGIGINDGNDILFSDINSDNRNITLRITFKGSTATVTVEDSTREYLPIGEQFVLEKVDSYYQY